MIKKALLASAPNDMSRLTGIGDGFDPAPRRIPEILQAPLRPVNGLKAVPLGHVALQCGYEDVSEPRPSTPLSAIGQLLPPQVRL